MSLSLVYLTSKLTGSMVSSGSLYCSGEEIKGVVMDYYGYFNGKCVCWWEKPPMAPWKGMQIQIEEAWFQVESVKDDLVILQKLGN